LRVQRIQLFLQAKVLIGDTEVTIPSDLVALISVGVAPLGFCFFDVTKAKTDSEGFSDT
jgi:hypothetical protein